MARLIVLALVLSGLVVSPLSQLLPSVLRSSLAGASELLTPDADYTGAQTVCGSASYLGSWVWPEATGSPLTSTGEKYVQLFAPTGATINFTQHVIQHDAGGDPGLSMGLRYYDSGTGTLVGAANQYWYTGADLFHGPEFPTTHTWSWTNTAGPTVYYAYTAAER